MNPKNNKLVEFIGVTMIAYIFISQFTNQPPLLLSLMLSGFFFITYDYLMNRKSRKLKREKEEEEEEFIEIE